MKNKAKKQQKINVKKVIIVLAIILLLSILYMVFKAKPNNEKLQIAEVNPSTYSIEIGTNKTIINFDKAIAATREEINVPKLGAGMIPVINIGNGEYKITTANDTNWYDYTKNEPAYIMLSDGYYKSELEQGIDNTRLAENNVGVGVPDDPNSNIHTGTIYMWIPRFAYSDENIGFLKETGVINASNWITPEVFTLKQENEKNNIELTGIWIEKITQTSESATNAKITQMDNIDNTYGLIANEKIFKVDEDLKQGLEPYNKYYNLDTYIDNYENNNRTCIKIINTNAKQELVAKADMVGKKVRITIQENKYDIDKIVHIASGKTVEGNEYTVEKPGGFYSFIVVDTKGNMVTVSAGFEENPPDLTGFRIDSTYIVTYSGEINKGTAQEVSSQTIAEILDDGYTVDENNALIQGDIDFSKVNESRGKWYDYANQKWANIVTRNNGNEAYFVWIPRYAYALNTTEQTTDIVFIDTDNVSPKTGAEIDLTKYTIPEAFTWYDDDGNEIALSGYWMGKYQLSSYVSLNLSASTYSGINKIRVTNISNNIVSTTNARYELTLTKDGEIIKTVDVVNENSYEFSEATGTKLEGGEYKILIKLYDEENSYIGENVFYGVAYGEPNLDTEPNPPDLTGFNASTTYYVIYNEDGTEDSSIPITQAPPENWYNYAEQKWANIVTKNNDKEAYFVWIPRYEYHAYGDTQTTDVYFISTTKTEATYGFTIPEAFTWYDDDGNEIALSGYWMGKYQLSN